MSANFQPTEEVYLVLGCFGRNDDGFVSCRSIENPILQFSSHIENHQKMADYFESCRLFDRPMFEFNAIKNFLYQMRERFDQVVSGKRLWTEKQYELYQKFLIEHRHCGLYLKLKIDHQEIEPEEEKVIKITAKSNINTNGINNRKALSKILRLK